MCWCEMFPKPQHAQTGFLIPLAAIIILGLAVLAVAISRLSGQTQTIVFQQGIAAQAFYAAESGAQYGMNQLFVPLVARAETDGRCTTLSGQIINFSVTGLASCSASLLCSTASDPSNTTSYYTISSFGQCGSGDLLAERVLEVSAFARDD